MPVEQFAIPHAVRQAAVKDADQLTVESVNGDVVVAYDDSDSVIHYCR